MSEEQARQLLALYIRQGCTPAQKTELFRWINASDNAELQHLLQEVWADFVPGDSIDNDRAAEMLSQIFAHDNEAQIAPKRPLFTAWRKWSAAAAAILLITGPLVYYFNKPATAERPKDIVRLAPPPAIKADKLPGSTRAVLTLGDGSSIALDTVSGGAVALQGNAQIVKKNGGVLYQQDAAKAPGPIYNTLSTGRGNQYPLTLSDGTRVWLNSSSSIRFPVMFAGPVRPVEITGEAYFEVAKNGRPFIVTAGEARVEVLGTHFNINAYTDEEQLKTTLLEGAVRITRGTQRLLLNPGQQAQIRKDGAMVLQQNAETEEAISWTQGYFHFTNAGLEAVLRQVSRWYDVDVIYERHSQEETFSGDIQKSLTLLQVLKLLDKSQVKFQLTGKQLVVR